MKKLGSLILILAAAGIIMAADYTPQSSEVSLVQSAAVTSTASTLQTNTFATAFAAAPIVTCTYTEDPGDVRPIYIVSTSASGFVCTVTADKNFAYTAVGGK